MNTPQPYESLAWSQLRAKTSARIGLDRNGSSLTTGAILDFRAAHAAAKDALLAAPNPAQIRYQLQLLELEMVELSSAVSDLETFLLRPDLGRVLSEDSIHALNKIKGKGADISLLISPGLSAPAIEKQAIPFLQALLPLIRQEGLSMSQVIWVNRGRVAVGDPVGELLQSRLTLILIGERPGLSAPDSMGCYLTYEPKRGRTDANRNCISNIRPEGLNHEAAANTAIYLIRQSLLEKRSGVLLKDHSGKGLLPDYET